MIWLIRVLGLAIAAIAILQIKRSFKYPEMFSDLNLDEGKINIIVLTSRIGGAFGIAIAIWLLFFAKL